MDPIFKKTTVLCPPKSYYSLWPMVDGLLPPGGALPWHRRPSSSGEMCSTKFKENSNLSRGKNQREKCVHSQQGGFVKKL